MKLNKWTVGLAAVGAISLSSAVQAEETQMNVVNAMTSGTTISGYVSTSFRYNLNSAGPGTVAFANGGIASDSADALGGNKANGFNLDVINLTIEKPLDESEWAAGYKAELLFGPDAAGVGTSLVSDVGGAIGASTGSLLGSDWGIKQAYVNLRAPVGNGVELKMGVFDTIIGYEAFNAPANPNYTRSLGWGIEPTQHTGLLASYQINDIVSVSAGIAETASAAINNRPAYTGTANFTDDQFNLTYLAAVAVTAPEDMGVLAGSTLYGGVVYGRYGGTTLGLGSPGNTPGGNQANYYVGATVATGVEGLSVGGAFDYQDQQDTGGANAGSGSQWAAGLYASFQATEKLSLHARGEYYRGNSGFGVLQGNGSNVEQENWEGTLTAQYDLWQNVITRLEYRWDSRNNGTPFGDASAGTTLNNAHLVALNVIYVF